MPCFACSPRSHIPPQHFLSALADLASPPQHLPSLQQSAPSLQQPSLPSRAHILPSPQHFPSLQQSMALPSAFIFSQHGHAAFVSPVGVWVVAVWAIIATATININTSTKILDFTISSQYGGSVWPRFTRLFLTQVFTEMATHVALRGLRPPVCFLLGHRALVPQSILQLSA